MRFCLQCGTPLPDAPMVVNLGNQSGQSGGQGQSGFGQTMETQVSNRGAFQNNMPPPNSFQNPPNFSNVPPAKPKNNKTFMIVGGIAGLLLLIFTPVAGVVGYNWFVKNDVIVANTSPSPSTSPSSSSSTSPSKSPTKSPTEEPSATPVKKTNSSMKAELKRMWIEYNVTEGGEKGMRIHVNYSVHGMKGVPSYLALYFAKESGDKLKNSNTGYTSSDGQLALYKEMEPAYEDTVYEDSTLFLPYDEINLSSGKYDLEISADVIYKESGLIAHLKDYPFVFEVK